MWAPKNLLVTTLDLEGITRRRLSDNGIDAGDIYSILEVKLDYAPDASAYRYVPMYYRSDKLLPGSMSRKRGVAYNLSLLGPGATPNGTQYNSAVVQVGEVSGPKVLDRRLETDGTTLDKMTTGWVQRPGLTPSSFASYLRRSREDNPAMLELMPAVLRAELVQTVKPSDVAKFAAAILSGSKAGLVAAAGKELAPVDADDQRQKVLNAEVAVKTAEAELAAARAENNPSKIALAEAKLAAAKDLKASLE